jgi:hypothetical protein
MEMAFIGVLLLCLAALAMAATLLRQAGSPGPADPGWLASFSVEKYRPMERLLCESDYSFLAKQPGFQPEIARRLRRERCRIYRAYLRELVIDFNRLHRAAVELALASPVDRSQYAGMLMRQKMSFQLAVAAVRVRLAMSRLGLGPTRISPVLAVLGDLHQSALMLGREAGYRAE